MHSGELKQGPDLFYENKWGGGLTIDPFYITRNNFGTSLATIRCETLTPVEDDILSRAMSKLFDISARREHFLSFSGAWSGEGK